MLYDYDTDRDDFPGLLIQKGGSGADETDSTKIQRWQTDPLEFHLHLSDDSAIEFYAAMKDFKKERGKVWAYLIDRDDEQATVIASGSSELQKWDKKKWKRETIEFEDLAYTVFAGHRLEIAFTVDSKSRDDMWFAYGTTGQMTHLRMTSQSIWANSFLRAIGAPEAWAQGYEGQGDVRVAVVDSGVWKNSHDFKGGGPERLIHEVNVNPDYIDAKDKFGHGTFMAGIIGSDGGKSKGLYKGVAPQVEIISVRVSGEWGGATESTVVAGLQWVLEHKDEYNIRVVNLSLNSTVAQAYYTSPLDAAVEILWFNGLVVVTSSGNNGDEDQGVIYPPANDPFAIVVGATDDMGTAYLADDIVAEFSAYGTTPEGFFRPDLAAPGTYVIASLADNSHFDKDYEDNHIETPDNHGHLKKTNFVASGTSVSAAVVSGASALLLQAMPDLNPDQVKWLLMNTATAAVDEPGVGAGVVNVARAIETSLSYGSADTVPAANTGSMPHFLHLILYKAAALAAWGGAGWDSMDWDSINWDSINWDSINWDSINWDSINWDSINWDSINWDSINWDSINWDSINWDSINWDSINWDSINWDSINWDSINWDSINWDSINWDSINWDSINWDSINWDSINWDSINWDSINWDSINWDSINWDSINWDSINWDSINWDSINWDSINYGASVDLEY